MKKEKITAQEGEFDISERDVQQSPIETIRSAVKEADYYECERCSINSLTKGRYCPCPRGSCEAKITGKIIRTIVIVKTR